MSIDPAIQSRPSLSGVLPLDELPIRSGSIYIFDFDGVLASGVEDDIYRLPSIDSEVELISSGARHFGIRCEGLEQRYQRHLVYQAAAWKLGLKMEVGPGFEQAVNVNSIAPLFVLTARSGWFATERLRGFLAGSNLLPVEIYNVGRVKKDRQVELICQEFKSYTVFFIDDSESHLAGVDAECFPNLKLVLAEQQQARVPEVLLRERFEQAVRDALATC